MVPSFLATAAKRSCWHRSCRVPTRRRPLGLPNMTLIQLWRVSCLPRKFRRVCRNPWPGTIRGLRALHACPTRKPPISNQGPSVWTRDDRWAGHSPWSDLVPGLRKVTRNGPDACACDAGKTFGNVGHLKRNAPDGADFCGGVSSSKERSAMIGTARLPEGQAISAARWSPFRT